MVKFGTSGLRGLAVDLDGPPAIIYTQAFLRVMAARRMLGQGDKVCVGRDLRASSPSIAAHVVRAIAAAGYQPVECGELPTPALSLYAMSRGHPSIMVTGSHIPEDRNGLKFYRPDGEIDKADEVAITEQLDDGGPLADTSGRLPVIASPMADYVQRYSAFFGPSSLKGLKVGVYQHSTVLRDVLMEILADCGAEPVALGRSATFVPVDTEAVHPDDILKLRNWAREGAFDAIVSSDGDADRPLIADERGEVVRGDATGIITSAALFAKTVVTPLTSNSAIEGRLPGVRVVRTAVGSPFVISGIDAAIKAGGEPVVGFEANGGFILGSRINHGNQYLDVLPTRDAVLPILACLAQARAQSMPLSRLVADLGFRAARSNRLQNIDQVESSAFLNRLKGGQVDDIRTEIGEIISINSSDGLRFLSDRKEMIYFRASGNAPELRCYVEAELDARADDLLSWGLEFAERNTRPSGQ